MINNHYKPDDEPFVYDLDDAIGVVWENIPQYLREKYSFHEIYFIMETGFEYLESIGIFINEDAEMSICEYPRDIDQPKMEKIIADAANEMDIPLTHDELADILEAEFIYYDMNGALGDAGEFLN